MVCDFTFFSKFSTRKKVQSSFCHKGLSHFPYGVQLGLTHCDQKEPKSNLVFGLGSFRLVDAFGLSSTQVESGSPSEQSREVLAHQRLRSVTSNLLRSHPIISTTRF